LKLSNQNTEIINAVLHAVNAALEKKDVNALADCFHEVGYWRDLLAFTWNIKTLEDKAQISEMLQSQLQHITAGSFRLDPNDEANEENGLSAGWIVFDNDVAEGYGHIRVLDGKIYSLLTAIKDLKGHEERVGMNRVLGTEHSAGKDRLNWKDSLELERRELGYSKQPYALIIGGGQNGIVLGARLRMLGVPAIIIEKNRQPGDNWRKRYKSLYLHDPVWFDHLPYMPFPDSWPVFTPKDKMGDWLEVYTRVMELNYWTNSSCKKAVYDEKSETWSVSIVRDGEEITLQATQLIIATGRSGKVNMPSFKGMEKFKGEQHHSSAHPGPDAYKGKKAVVIGSNNSAHDIAAALWENAVDVTMVQRSSTHVVRSEPLMELALNELYSEQAVARGITTEKADMIMASLSANLLTEGQKQIYTEIQKRDAEFYERLRKAGFKLDFGEDGSGAFVMYLRRGSGYYIDVGASELVADGKIKLKTITGVKEITEDSVIFDDDSELKADLIVYATGYGNMIGWIEELISREVAEKVGICGGLGSDTTNDPGPWEGESRNLWKPTQQPNLWFQAGNLYQARFYSRQLALQIKARMEGIQTPVYGIPEAVNPNPVSE
tara:strand:- start:3046 stop:4863 length:1818 start_codon:yes stop_codon:yes gene_type:complete